MVSKVFSKTLGLGLEIQYLVGQNQVLVVVLTEFSNQDKYWSWCKKKISGLSELWSAGGCKGLKRGAASPPYLFPLEY